jgi:hypothetical protein
VALLWIPPPQVDAALAGVALAVEGAQVAAAVVEVVEVVAATCLISCARG